MSQDIFLDTDIIMKRAFGDVAVKKAIDDYIKDANKSATTYIKAELNRGIIRDVIFLHSVLAEERDLPTVFARLKSFPTTERQRKRRLEILERISDKRQLRIADTITKLESLIFALSRSMLLQDIALVPSGTKCALANREIEKRHLSYSIDTSCTRQSPVCSVADYMKTNLAYLKNIDAFVRSYPHFYKLRRVLAEVAKDPRKAKGRNCLTLGDVIICLDSPDGYGIASTNAKDFEPICKCLGKPFIRIVL